MGEIDQGLQKGPIATSKPTEIWEMRGYVEFNLSQRCFGPAQFEATLLRQTYLRKIVSPRQKKKKENVSPFLFSFFFRVFVSSPSTVNRDESVDRLCTNENVGQRHRIDVSPRFFSYSSSSSNKIHPRLFENCMFFREISILTRHAAFMQFFLQNASFYKTRTRVTTYLSLSPSPFFFSKKLETIAFVRLSSLRSFSHRSVSLPKQEETSLIEFWNSRIRTRDISFFFPSLRHEFASH